MGNEFLFINGIIPNLDFLRTNDKNSLLVSSDLYQKSLIKGLKENGIRVNSISLPFIGAFPNKFKKINIPSYKDDESTYLGFNNIWGIRNISRYLKLKKYLRKNIKNINTNNVLIYSAHTPFVKVAKLIKKYNKNADICLIVPDLPQYMNLNKKKSFIYRIFKKIDINSFNKQIKYIDRFVFFTKYMNDFINKYNRPYIVIEAIPSNSNNEFKILNNKKKKIVYAGTTNEAYGIIDLIKAFKIINNPNYELDIYGTGDVDNILKEESNKNKNINYYGLISKDVINSVINNADVLVNPRSNKFEYTKYSFPSKIIEYISTGRPVVCYKLDGIPNEYDDVLFYTSDDSINALAMKLKEVLNLSNNELNKIFEKSKKLIDSKKPSLSAKKLINFMRRANQ